jgi:hypothetical protein
MRQKILRLPAHCLLDLLLCRLIRFRLGFDNRLCGMVHPDHFAANMLPI